MKVKLKISPGIFQGSRVIPRKAGAGTRSMALLLKI